MTALADGGSSILERVAGLKRPALYLLVGVCLLAHIRWVPEVISLSAPMQVPTAGSAGESLHCIWKWVHGMQIYTDITRIPYSSAYFNWLHYLGYGEVCRSGLLWLGLDDAWIPTIACLLTIILSLGGVIVGALVFYKAMPHPRSTLWDAVALALVLFGGPMAIGWNLSPRPDVGALVMECAGAGLALAAIKRAEGSYVLWMASGAAFAAAWSMRVINVGCLCGVTIWLLALRRRKACCALLAPMVVVVVATFLIGGKLWRENALFGGADSPFGLEYALVTMARSVAKAPLTIAAILSVGFSLRRGTWRMHSVAGFWSTLMGTTFAVALFTSLKLGSDQNYWFSFHLASIGFVATFWKERTTAPPPHASSLPGAVVAACLMLSIAVQAGYVWGKFRVVDTEANARLAGLKTSLKDLPGPVLVCCGFYDNLPWVTGHRPPFVYAWTYPQLRERGVAFERDGLRGLIGTGYFGTIVCPVQVRLKDATDGASLDRYGWKGRDKHYDFFVVKSRVPGVP